MRKFLLSAVMALAVLGSLSMSAEAQRWRGRARGYYFPGYSYYAPGARYYYPGYYYSYPYPYVGVGARVR